jgi:endogenous inhibitor of DNA gyrase (YacG/DUF329 family)
VSDAAAPKVWRCPTCGKAVAADGPYRPFCTDRCKNVDLGAWLLGHYRIPAVADPDAELDAGAVPPPDDTSDPKPPDED